MARTFGKTWWGRAWIDALVGIAGGEDGRLSRGRTYARHGRAEDLIIEPGSVQAWVQGSRPDPYEVYLDIRQFRADEWDVVLDAIAAKAAHAAALLDGEIDPGVVDDAESVDVHLLPRARDLRTACTCPDEVEPCKHAAAVTYLIADAIDHDPFVLLLVRGRRREQVLDEIRARRAAPTPTSAATVPEEAATGADTDAGSQGDGPGPRWDFHDDHEAVPHGMDPAEAWGRTLGELPVVPLVGSAPGRPAAWPSDPPPHAPFSRDGLRTLITDAAQRAWELAGGTSDTGLDLDADLDLARRAASASPAERHRLADHAGTSVADLEVVGQAWQAAGPAGVRATDEARWQAPPLKMAAARDVICDSGFSARRVHVSGNRITVEGRLQFRLSRDGNWYLFSKASGRWTLAGPPDPDIEELVLRDLPE